MPEEMERKLKAEAKKKGMSKEKMAAYVYGTMRKTGWKPSREKGKNEDHDREMLMSMRAHKAKIK